jgi:hypothetical protein
MVGKIITLLLLSSVKFVFAFPLAYAYKMNMPATVITTCAGGIGGILFFAYISDYLIILWHRIRVRYFTRKLKVKAIPKIIDSRKTAGTKKVFTPKTKRYVRIKQRYGIIGISLLTPVLLSIPIGTFLAIRFYRRKKSTLIFLAAAVVFWSLVLSTLLYVFEFRIV